MARWFGRWLLGAAVALRIQRPGASVFDYVPASSGQQLAGLWGLAVLGMFLQWMQTYDIDTTDLE